MVCLNQLEEHTRRTLSAIGLTAKSDRALRVDNYMGVVQAAERGLGVTVIYATPDKPFEAEGRLVALSRDPIPAPFAMYFVCRQGDKERPDLVALREWLVDCILN